MSPRISRPRSSPASSSRETSCRRSAICSARFGVGRPAIREALIALQKAGLVELTNGARARVLMPTASHIFTGMAPAVRQMLSTEEGSVTSRAPACSSRSAWRARRRATRTDDDLKR